MFDRFEKLIVVSSSEKARRLWEEREKRIEIEKLKQQRTISRSQKENLRHETYPLTHNPFAPAQAASIERPVCSYFLKTGVCRYNERSVDFPLDILRIH